METCPVVDSLHFLQVCRHSLSIGHKITPRVKEYLQRFHCNTMPDRKYQLTGENPYAQKFHCCGWVQDHERQTAIEVIFRRARKCRDDGSLFLVSAIRICDLLEPFDSHYIVNPSTYRRSLSRCRFVSSSVHPAMDVNTSMPSSGWFIK
jgi:hypothetical protein